MDQGSWLSCEKTAILQGGFLLASQLCQPEPFSALRKEDWGRVGGPVVQAVAEICGQFCVGNQDGLQWRKRILCIIWNKILEMERMEDIDRSWMENPLFAVQNSLPSINHTVLFELVKSLGFSTTYVELLLCFQEAEQCRELERLARYVTVESTDADVKLLLDVCWELLRGRQKEEDSLDRLFTAQLVRVSQNLAGCTTQASKRFKPDPESSASAACKVSILFQGLNDIKEYVTSTALCHFALSNCLDMLYTSYLLDHATDLPVEVKLRNIVWLVSLQRKTNLVEGNDLIQAIRECHRDLAATFSPARSKPSGMTSIQAMQMTLGIIRTWEERGLLREPTSEPSVLAVRCKDSICRVLKSLEQLMTSESLEDEQSVNSLKGVLKDLLASLSFTVPEGPSAEMECIVTAIIDNNIQGFQELPKLYASKLSLTFSETEWLSCLERNKGAFQQKDLVMTLVSTLIAKCQSEADVNHSKRLKDVTVDVFCRLPLTDKNVILSEVLAMSQRGLHGCLPSAVTKGYEEELNLAFNCIVQGGAQGSLSSAISAVARVAFQNPEAAMRRCCRAAVVNVGADRLLARILQQLPGLRGLAAGTDEARRGWSLLCECLRAAAWNKLSSPKEEDQLLRFLSALMEPSAADQTGEKCSFLLPEECVRAFVLPHVTLGPGARSLELCLRVLQAALAHAISEDAAPWIINCSPFPLLYCLSQLLNNCSRCWEQPLQGDPGVSIETKELLISILITLGKAVGKQVALAPGTWSRALSWLYGKVEQLDWTIRFHMKEVWGEHFKYEVPSSLMAVCELSEQEWSGLELPQYGQGTGLLAWVECCCLSDRVRETMMGALSLNLRDPEEVNMFSKGLLVALSQTLPWCAVSEWERLLTVLRELLRSEKLHVPYSLEYVDFLPFLDLRPFACDLRLSVLMLRVFQLLCGFSCEGWLPPRGWAHVSRLYAAALRVVTDSVKDVLPLPSAASPGAGGAPLNREVLFVLTQLYCHTLHVQVMMPGEAEPLFLRALEILSHYEAVLAAYPKSSTPLQAANTRHFLTTITDNLQCAETRAVLQQKIAQLGD
ncbi:gem-associated protein 4 [Electrophorus electricus]|uniref:Gem-associated protein 4 n=1 Tax=Electrophorus electricus TaxID=8005 RepID=A0AAY5EU72_ELEEL|nr:gem-associated protein 4 [Electrophorus electricus]